MAAQAARVILAGDIGGTKSLLGLFERGARQPVYALRLASAEFPDLETLLARFLEAARGALGAPPRLEAAGFGVAGPVAGERVRVTNLPWVVEAPRLAARLALGQVLLLNDFAAAAWGVDTLERGDVATLQRGEPLAGAPRVVLGAGTGLGIAYAFADAEGYRPVPGEGGHAAFAPSDQAQLELWRHLHARLGRVTLEDVLSGKGLERIHEFLEGAPAAAEDASGRALDLFIACYGAAAGDHALNVMARGGVFVAGGIAQRILPRLEAGGFIAAFNAKGAFAEHARRMPVYVVTEEKLGLYGAALAAARGQ